jgi:tRNA nucleotidyltransferase (CCA-adding enzyme)
VTNFDDRIPQDVTDIILKLENSGYEAYIVGGCVRDLLLDIKPKDWDITTNAMPREVKMVFENEHVIPTGEKYGTVTILKNNIGYEVTTYRADGNYSDGRRPDEVTFSNSLIEDLKRRDFTINAMAYNSKVGLIDEFGGLDDLKYKIIKCVGNPFSRFNEDALRIMRCVRFAIRYDFDIENQTSNAMLSLVESLNHVSVERISKELNEIILKCKANHHHFLYKILLYIIPELDKCIDFSQHNPYHYLDVYGHIMESVFSAKDDLNVKLAMLFHDIGKPNCFTLDDNGIGHFYGHAEESMNMARDILNRLRFDNKTIDTVCKLIKYHDSQISSRKAIKRLMNKIGDECFELLLEVKEADIKSQTEEYYIDRHNELISLYEIYKDIKEQNEAVKIKDLKINGCDIMGLLDLKPSNIIGEILNNCLDAVINEEIDNSREILLDYVKIKFATS